MHCLINCGCFNGRKEENLGGADHDVQSRENTGQGQGTKNKHEDSESFLVICPNKGCGKEYFHILTELLDWESKSASKYEFVKKR